jgi:2'-5' RNA ligase
MNETYSDYRARLQAKLAESVAPGNARPRKKYIRPQPNQPFCPADYPGCTVLATPYPLTMVQDLIAAQNRLSTISPGFACVPENSLHITLTELLAGAAYQKLNPQQQLDLINRAQHIVGANPITAALRARIIGLSSFPGVIVALVDFPDDASYAYIRHLRDQFYRDALLAEFGLREKRAFVCHVTLAYVEDPLPTAQELEAVAALHLKTSDDFFLDGVGVFVFPNMSEFRSA